MGDQGYRDLIAWQKGMALSREVYQATRSWPQHELFGLTSQTRRSAVSIAANIAEGKGRYGVGEFLHHRSIAHGSRCELETHLMLAESLGYLDAKSLKTLIDQSAELGRSLRGLMQSLR